MRAILALSVVLAAILGITASTQASGTFAPTITLETSTTRATAHPDARITIDNSASSDNIKDMTLSLPDGFWGSLGAVQNKCSEADAVAGTCAADSKIGTVTATADIEDPDTDTTAEGVLSGDVFLTEAFSGNDDPAGVSILVHAKVGGVDLGKVIINGRAKARTYALPGAPGNAKPEIRGLDTVVQNIPQSITDTNARTVDYKVDKMQIDLISKLQSPSDPDPDTGYLPPLLTNPSRCGTYQITAVATPYGGGSDATISDDYTVDQCDTAHFAPTFTNSFVNEDFNVDGKIAAGKPQAVYASMAFPAATDQPDANSSLDSFTMYLPRGMGANYGAFGLASQMCNGGSAIGQASGHYWFDPSGCPATANIGYAYISTPLLPVGQQLYADIYAINTTPVPSLAIAAEGGNNGNPAGINVYLVGKADNYKLDPSCTSSCEPRIGVVFSNLPDTPVTGIDVTLDPGPNRAGSSLQGRFISQADPGTGNCQENNDTVVVMNSSAGTTRSAVQTQETTCTGLIHPTDGPWGQVTDDATPTFDFTYSGAQANIWCGIDTIWSTTNDCKSALSLTAPAQATGAHSVLLGDGSKALGNKSLVRDFVVQTDPSYDTGVPTTTLSAGPGTPGPGTGETADSTPSFSFNASETSTFQCSLDDGAFLPCGSANDTDTTSYSIPDDEYLDASDTVHTFAVRAQDTAGNVDLTPAEASFKIVKPFEPQININLTTVEARKHPEMTVTVDNPSHEDIKEFELKMPDGLFGGLTGVAGLCSVADADSGDCTSGSQVGTVEATALIDRSTAHITGKVYLTEPRAPYIGVDPAGLTIEVLPKLQDVTFKPVRINARLSVRGEAQGINTAAIDIPNTAESTLDEVSEFDVRQMVIKLTNNSAAPQPLLTNPSSCDAKSFDVSFKGYESTSDSTSVPFQATNCGALGFSPALSFNVTEHSTGGPPGVSNNVRRAAVDMTASVVADPNGAGIKTVDLRLPAPITINPQLLPEACQPAQAAAKLCPASTAIGTVTATSPLLTNPMTGTIYLLKSNTSLPKLLFALRGQIGQDGRISVDLVASNTFTGPKFNQIRTTMDTVPDVPLSTFSMQVSGLLTTRPDSCESPRSDWNFIGTLGGFNGAASPVNVMSNFDCPNVDAPTVKTTFKNKKAKSTLTQLVTAQSGTQMKKVTVKLPKGLKFNKSSFTKKKIKKFVSVTDQSADSISSKCFKLKNTTTFEINFCGKAQTVVTIRFKSGSITSKTKSKKLKFKTAVADSTGAKKTAKPVN